MSRDVQAELKSAITSHPVILFMKGSRDAPQCGFSDRVVEILKSLDTDFATVDVLSDPEVRQGVKDYANWPTIPQLYIKGEFIGGCDIITDMHLSGELQTAVSG
jgi:monothiol glutaredoxin